MAIGLLFVALIWSVLFAGAGLWRAVEAKATQDNGPPRLIPKRELVVVEGHGLRCVVMWPTGGGIGSAGGGSVSCIRWAGGEGPLRYVR